MKFNIWNQIPMLFLIHDTWVGPVFNIPYHTQKLETTGKY